MEAEEIKTLWMDLLHCMGHEYLETPVRVAIMIEMADRLIPAEIIPSDFVVFAALDFIKYTQDPYFKPDWITDSIHLSCVKFIAEMNDFAINKRLKAEGGLN